MEYFPTSISFLLHFYFPVDQEHRIPYPAPASLNVAKILLELVEEIRILNIRGNHLQKQNEQIYLMLVKGHVAGAEGETKKTADYEIPRFPLKSSEETRNGK